MKWSLCFVALLFAGVSYAAPPPNIEAQPDPVRNARFTNQSGWIGADGNYSITLSPERTLWFFSDTLIGDVVSGRREKTVMINNSIGIETTRQGQSQVEFHWGSGDKKQPVSSLLPPDQQGWFWPFAGVYAQGKVELFLMQMEKTNDPGAFGFRTRAVWHATIANPLEVPSKWKIRYQQLPFTELEGPRRILFGSAAMIHDQHIYIYGYDERPKVKFSLRGAVVARVPIAEVSDFAQWRFWTGEVWSKDFRDSKGNAQGVATEYSVMFQPTTKRFWLVTQEAFLSPKIIGMTSESPTGPWSKPITLYDCPEAKWKKDIFCYSGKAHTGWSRGNELLITYAANSGRFADLFEDPRLYWPKFVRVRLGE